jgi:menaquinone-dependent protoporphyrinogen oxidase
MGSLDLWEVPGMRVVVAYASAYGSTKGIAKEIGDRLTKASLQAEFRPIDEIEAIETYDAVVLGSAIHNMAWLPQAAAFVRTHTADLASRQVWLFSVSSVGDTSSFFGPRVTRFMRRMRKEPKEIAGFRQTIRPRDHRNFAGAIERTHWSLAGNLFLKAFRGNYGDHRDWRDIDAWADGIARQLRAAPEAALS